MSRRLRKWVDFSLKLNNEVTVKFIERLHRVNIDNRSYLLVWHGRKGDKGTEQFNNKHLFQPCNK
eukprot:scaffold25664_cov12-Tisochrysis_lutea.AAC.1